MMRTLNRGIILVLISAVALLTILQAVAPVFAETSKKIPVTMTRTGAYWILGTEYWTTTDSKTYHAREGVYGFNSNIIQGPGINLKGSFRSVVSQNFNNNTNSGEERWDSTITLPDGTFEGVTHVKGEFRDYFSKNYPGLLANNNTETRSTYHGTGAYLGWTLIVESEFVNATSISPTGYLMVPRDD